MQSQLCDSYPACYSTSSRSILDVGTCGKINSISSGSVAFYLEGLSVLSNKTNNSTFREMWAIAFPVSRSHFYYLCSCLWLNSVDELARFSMTTELWVGSIGVITEGTDWGGSLGLPAIMVQCSGSWYLDEESRTGTKRYEFKFQVISFL